MKNKKRRQISCFLSYVESVLHICDMTAVMELLHQRGEDETEKVLGIRYKVQWCACIKMSKGNTLFYILTKN